MLEIKKVEKSFLTAFFTKKQLKEEVYFKLCKKIALYIYMFIFDKNSETFCMNYFRLFDNISTLVNLLVNKRFQPFWITIRWTWYCALPLFSLFSSFSVYLCIAICRSQMQLSLHFFDNCKIGRSFLNRNNEGFMKKIRYFIADFSVISWNSNFKSK